MHSTLLATKLFIPPATPDRINRERLLERLDTGLSPGHPLILVCAPAGYGKTTMLSEWVASHRSHPITFCWLSLETADDTSARFFAYLAAALDKAITGILALMDDLLSAPQLPTATELATALVNPLADYSSTLVIVLDDYQNIHDVTLHSAVSFLVEHLPPQVHLALGSRSDPPLPLHRLRARGQLVELRLSDLRFNSEETSRMFELPEGAPLSETEIKLIEERTEGWAAGLRMALLSIQGKADRANFIHQFSGSHRYILDYLAEEIFNSQNEEIQSFLLQTAVLERLCAPLCNALTGRTDGQACLETLERANCFLIALDDEHNWYRYHHLFADLLRVRLKQSAQDQSNTIIGLHQRAAEWLEANHDNEDALQHSLQAGDFDRAARIVENSTLELFARGRLHQLLAWVRLLPAELTQQRSWLNVYQAWTLAFAARLPEAEQLLANAETILKTQPQWDEDRARIQAEISAVRALVAMTCGDLPTALALADQQAQHIPAQGSFARSVQQWAVGYALRMKGDLEAAQACFAEALNLGYELDNLWTICSTSADLGAILRQKGDLRQAEAVFRAGLKRATQAYGGPGYIGRLEAFLASLLLERGEREEAKQQIALAIQHNRQWENPNHCAYAWMVRTNIALVEGQNEEAQAALKEANAWVERSPVVPPLRFSIEATQVNSCLKNGQVQEAIAWLERHPFSQPGAVPPAGEIADAFQILNARILLAAGKSDAAHPMLLQMEQDARRSGKNGVLIEILLLLAQTSPDPATAFVYLRDALELGLPRGYRQVFLNAGEKIIDPLEACQDIPSVVDLLAELRSTQKDVGDHLLTAREIEILRWMASGLSNPQIGARLYISAGTVKAHTAAIYRKLNAANRAEAIARAKDLGLL